MPARQRLTRLAVLVLFALVPLLGMSPTADASAESPSGEAATPAVKAPDSAALLATQLQAELTRLGENTAAFARNPVFRQQEHWYRPWQENAIVLLMDRALDNFDNLLLTELVDLRGQLVAVNAHDGQEAPLSTHLLYLEDYGRRPWFTAMAGAGPDAAPRLDGPLADPDVSRIYPGAAPCLRVTVPVTVDGEVVALLSHCLRFAPLSEKLSAAMAAPGAAPGLTLALLAADGHLLAGTVPGLGVSESALHEYPVEAPGMSPWVLRAYLPQTAGWRNKLAGMLPPLPDTATLLRWPGRIFAITGTLILLLLGAGLLRARRAAVRPASPGRPPMAVPRGPLTPAEKALELLNASLGAMLGTLHALAGGSQDLAERRLDPAIASGPGSTRGALRRVAGLRELLSGLDKHVTGCREGGLAAPMRQAVDIFGRVGRQMEALVEPLLETERRLASLPRHGLRSGAELDNYHALSASVHRTLGVMSALQGALGRLPRKVLRGEWSPGEAGASDWQRVVDELHELLLLLARQVGATLKLLELMPASAGSVIEVRDVSAAVLAGRSALAASASVGGAATVVLGGDGDGDSAAAAEATAEPEPRYHEAAASAAAPSTPRFEVLGGSRN